jgi:hypothetical protein
MAATADEQTMTINQSATGRTNMRRTAVIFRLAALPLGFAAAARAGGAGARDTLNPLLGER